MSAIEAAVAALTAERDALDQALRALNGLMARNDTVAPVLANTNGTTATLAKMRLTIAPDREAKARKNGQRQAAAGRQSAAAGWRAKAEPLLRKGEPVKAVAKACGVSEASVYTYQKTLGLVKRAKTGRPPKAKATETAPTYRCQHCGAHGTDPKRCSNLSCLEPR